MYKILIVDDEKMIRMGIKKVIDWKALGICEVFTASSAREALEIIEEYEPEIMITDIQMSEMTGLQLIEAARKRQPKLRVLVLTGYDSFEYARQSLRLQVQDLFLKPVDEEVLSKAVKAQVEYLEAAKAEEKSSLILQRTQGTVEQTQLEKIMRDLIHRRGEIPGLLERLKISYRMDVQRRLQMVLIVPTLYMSQKPPEENFRAMSVKNVCMSVVDAQEDGVTFSDDDGTIAVVYFLEGRK